MTRINIDDRVYLKSDLLANNGINHCFTAKCGGLSCGTVKGLNLGFRVGDDTAAVTGNYKLVAEDMGFQYERITAGRQTHSANIRIIYEEDAGKGVSRESEFVDVDGLVTNISRLPLVVYYADCVPVLMADKSAGVVAAVHSGWRGTVSGIAGNAVKIMSEQFNAKPENIMAVIGPSIGQCCFETGGEVACEFDDDLVIGCDNGKFMVDLWKANKRILLQSGLKEDNIEILKICTICNNDMLYSYRVNKESTGRMGAFIALD